MSVLKRWNGSVWEIVGPQITSTRFDDINKIIAPEYDPTKLYNINDYVIHGDKLYKCIIPIIAIEDWNDSHWVAVEINNEIHTLKNIFHIILDDTNLFNKDTAIDGERLSAAGAPLRNQPDYYTSVFIPVDAGKTYIKNSPKEDGYHRLCIYNNKQALIPNMVFDTNIVTIPKEGAYIKFCGEISEKEVTTFTILNIKEASKINDLYEKKADKIKTYTSIEGILHRQAMWGVDKNGYGTEITEGSTVSRYNYLEIKNGFTTGETYAFDAYQPSGVSNYSAIAFHGSNGQLIDKVTFPANTEVEKYEVTIPINTVSIYIHAYASHNIQANMYSINYVDTDFTNIITNIKFNEYTISNWMDRRYQDGEFEQYVAKTPDHLVVTFSVDDSYPDISDIATAFINAGVPLCLATVPNRLNDICNSGDTILKVCQDVQTNGGEILTHNNFVLGADTTPEQYLKYFVTSKKALVDAGLTVNGIIKAGGTEPGGPPSVPAMLRYLRSYYDYGTGFSTVGDGRFTIGRGHLKADTNFDAIKAQIDAASTGGIRNFYTHGQVDFPGDNAWVDKIMDLVNYILSKPNAEIVTIGDMFHNNYVKSFKT